MEIDPHIFRVLGLFLAILSPRKPPKLNIHFGYLPPTATLLGNVKLSIFYHFSLFGLVAQGGGTVSQIRGSGLTNKDEILMMMGILMLMLMLKVMRG